MLRFLDLSTFRHSTMECGLSVRVVEHYSKNDGSLVPRPSRGVERTAWDVPLAQARRFSALVRLLVSFTKPTHVDHIRTKNLSQYAKYGRLPGRLPVRSATQALNCHVQLLLVPVAKDDGLPPQICRSCAGKVTGGVPRVQDQGA